MKIAKIFVGAAASLALTASAAAQAGSAAPSSRLLSGIPEGGERTLLRDVLERNPEIAAARARAAAAAQRAPQVSALPDPVAAFTVYLQSPETRVGPQQGMVTLTQRIPWFGTLGLAEHAALGVAAAALADAEAMALDRLTDARVLLHEVAFVDQQLQILREEGETLDVFEELARARYASGVGLDLAVIKIQAEIARNQTDALGLQARRSDLVARINVLRDRLGAPLVTAAGEHLAPPPLELPQLREAALAARPELAAATARLGAAECRVELADKAFGPDLSAGLTYAAVGDRSDADVPDEGRDILGLTGSLSLPVWRGRLHAGVEEAVQSRLAAEQQLRAVVTSVEEEVADLVRRIPLLADQVQLFEEVLLVQAEESLSSALSAYASGTADALDLLDAERVLFQVRVGAARSRTDLANAIARLERAVARPLRHGGIQ